MIDIQEIIDKLREKGNFVLEDCPEDLNEDRTSYEELQQLYENLYYSLIEIEKTIQDARHKWERLGKLRYL